MIPIKIEHYYSCYETFILSLKQEICTVSELQVINPKLGYPMKHPVQK